MTLRLGVLTDLHHVPDPERRAAWINRYDFPGVLERCERAAELFAREGAERVVLLGDLSHDGDVPSLRRVVRAVSSDLPLFAVGGNHDSPNPSARIAAAAGDPLRMLGWRALGRGPARLAGVRVVRRAKHRWAAARRPALASWGERPVVLASHFPVLSRVRALTERGLPHAGDLVDRAAVARSLTDRGAPTVVLCGHIHVRDSVADGPLLQFVLGATVEPPFDATLVGLEVEGDRVVVTRDAHELGRAPERRNPRLVGKHETWIFERGRWRRR